MSDAHVHEQLGALLDGALSDGDAETVRRHVASCDVCRGELESLESLDADVSGDLGSVLKPTPELAQRIVAEFYGGETDTTSQSPAVSHSPRLRTTRIAHLLTGLAAGLVLAIILGEFGIGPMLKKPFEKRQGVPGSRVTVVAFRDDVKMSPVTMKNAETLYDADIKKGGIVTTEPGVLYELELADGSRVRLNDDSVLILEDRSLMLKQGQIWVEAVRDMSSGRPFEVKFPGGSLNTNAGVFTVAADGNSASIFCVRGPVTVGTVELRGEQSLLVGGKGIEEPDEVYFPEGRLSWLHPIWKGSPRSDELRLYIRGALGVLGDSKAGFMAREIILDLGSDAREELLSFIDRNRLTRNRMNRRAASELLPKVVSGTKDRALILRLFDLLADGDSEVAFHSAHAVSEATGITPEKKHDFRFWREADRKERETEMQKWRKLWESQRP